MVSNAPENPGSPDSPESRRRSSAEDLLAIAAVTKAHSLNGELSVKLLVPPIVDAVELMLGRKLFVRDRQGRVAATIEVEGFRPHRDNLLIKCVGIDDRTAAERFRSTELCVAREDLPALPEGSYWEIDLIGCEVVDERLGAVGTVEALDLETGQPRLIFRTPDGKPVGVPWVPVIFPAVDLAARRISARLPEGLPGLEDDKTESAGDGE